MDKRLYPWAALGAALMIVFIVWLFSSMTRTEDANRVVVTIAASAVAVGIALLVGFARRRRGSGDPDRAGRSDAA